MRALEAMIFDLDDTLLNRDMAVDKMFFFILEKYYMDVKHSVKREMLQKFKEHDKRYYGNNDKSKVLELFFYDFPPAQRLPRAVNQEFWDHQFPQCFAIDQNTLNVLNLIKMQVKIAIITNGSTERQKAKIMNTHLNHIFNTIIISEEVGISKPDRRIFKLALDKLNVRPEAALFVGDDLERDIGGCQNANIRGIWLNPHKLKNDTEIKPYAEINSLDSLLSYLSLNLAP